MWQYTTQNDFLIFIPKIPYSVSKQHMTSLIAEKTRSLNVACEAGYPSTYMTECGNHEAIRRCETRAPAMTKPALVARQ